jgi:probable rRNA maturation factor
MKADPDEPLLLNRQRRHRVERSRLLDFLGRLRSDLEVSEAFSVVLVRDAVIKRYNREFRGENKPTDVLSFPASDGYLGDILISVDTAESQAAQGTNLTLEKNLRRLALHGLLHLIGYDHETDQGEMRAIERRLRRRFGC